MNQRLKMDQRQLRNMTPELFETCRDYYIHQQINMKGRRSAHTSTQIKEAIQNKGNCKLPSLFRSTTKSLKITQSQKSEDREVFYMLMANAAGRRKTYIS